MYRGYQVELSSNQFDEYRQMGEEVYKQHKSEFRSSLSKHTNEFGNIDVSSLESDWFPMIDADIFISHSGKDRNRVYGLMGWLKSTFGLNVFVDSAIWGNSTDLLKEIDDKHCYNPDKSTYSYKKRNESTSHVHMILSMALTKMIDQSECILFCRTDNSVPFGHAINSTSSPWIYSEIIATQLLRRKTRDGFILHENVGTKEAYASQRIVSFEYELPLSEFKVIDRDNLCTWKNSYQNKSQRHALDVLYKLIE